MASRRDFADDEIRKIRTEARHWRQEVLARRWNASVRTISLIVNRLTYSHIA